LVLPAAAHTPAGGRDVVSGRTFWLMIGAIRLGTFLLRLSFVHWMGRRVIPPGRAAALRLVPAAALASLVLGSVLFPGGGHGSGIAAEVNLRPAAASVAALVAVGTPNVLLTIAAGMAALWMLRARL
jgi:branched-subunit amino acid transport protein